MGIFRNLIDKVLDTEDVSNGSGIKLDPESQKKEEQKFKEIAESTIEELKNCGLFKSEKISFLAEKINKITVPGYGFRDPFSYDDCLSVDEKKAIGLNTRQKFSREFIECLTHNGVKKENIKELLKITWLKNFHAICRKHDLLRMKETGIKTVKILDCGDERDCSKIKKFKKIWAIDEVPELPLAGCTAEYCRCGYIANDI